MLYGTRKFDIRVWTIFMPDGRLYFYKQGYLRTSSEEFTHDIKDNPSVHLTNNCFQRLCENYGKHEDGNTLSFQRFQEYLDTNYEGKGLSVEETFIPRIKDLIIDTYLSVKDQLNPTNRKSVFELFGYDFMIDEDF